MKAKNRKIREREGPPPELEIGVFPDRLEISERPGDRLASELIRRLRDYGIECELVFKAPCG